jgi:hypothetical protein
MWKAHDFQRTRIYTWFFHIYVNVYRRVVPHSFDGRWAGIKSRGRDVM